MPPSPSVAYRLPLLSPLSVFCQFGDIEVIQDICLPIHDRLVLLAMRSHSTVARRWQPIVESLYQQVLGLILGQNTPETVKIWSPITSRLAFIIPGWNWRDGSPNDSQAQYRCWPLLPLDLNAGSNMDVRRSGPQGFLTPSQQIVPRQVWLCV